MKKLYCLVCSLFIFSTIVFSQEKYLEIIVEDTIHVEADRIYYGLTLTEHDPTDKNKLENELSKLDIQVILENYPSIKLIDYNSSALGDSSPYARYQKTNTKRNSLILEIKDKEEFMMLYERLGEHPNISGRINSLSCDDNEAVELRSMKKLMEKGQIKADKMAALMDTKVDHLIEFVELPGDSKWKNLSKAPSWGAYPSLSLKQNNRGQLSLDRTTIIVLKQVKIKYILK